MYLTLTPEVRPSESYNVFVFALPERLAATSAARAPQPARVPAPDRAQAATPAISAATKCAHPRRGPAARSSVLDGVYTAAQSESGRRIYTARQCVSCHGANLQGTAVGPALAGEEFLSAWRGDTVGALSSCMQTTMPPGATGRLSAAEYRDLVAALLEANGFPVAKSSGAALIETAIDEVALK
jgi:mono/diheme cytochrome c family protein